MLKRARNRLGQAFARAPLPTRRTLLLAATAMIAAVWWGWQGALWLDFGLVVLCGVDFVLVLREGPLEAGRELPQGLAEGAVRGVEIVVRNPAARPRTVEVRDTTPLGWEPAPVLAAVVGPRSEAVLTYNLTPPRRGFHDFGDLWLRVAGPLELVLSPLRTAATDQVKVYPRLRPQRYADLATFRRAGREWGAKARRKLRERHEFESLRDYVEGDDPRHIHWKATARLDRPIVQEYRAERNQIVIIMLEAGRLMTAASEGRTKFDHALAAAGQLAQAALAGGDQVGVLVFADGIISFVPPGKTPGQMQRLLLAMMDVRPRLVEPHYEQAILWLKSRVRRRCLAVVFTDLVDEVASEALFSAVALLRPRHLPLCVAVAESEWGELMRRPPEKVSDVYQRAMLQVLLRQRAKALATLVQKGALVVDLVPSKLSVGLLERYFEVKCRGLL